MVGKLVYRVLLLISVTTIAVHAVEYERARYEVIVERSPFGEDPLIAQVAEKDAKASLAASAAAKRMEKEMRLCYLLEAQSGDIRAGFQNLKAKAGDPKSIMLMVNESFNGMKLTHVDIENNSATLSMNGKPVTFELTKGVAAPVKAAPAGRKLGGGFRKKATQPARPAEPQLTPEELAIKRAENTERLRQYQMEVIRKGQPPLPIPLTQEMDDQLVAEGLLSPEAP